MKIITEKVTLDELNQMARGLFGKMVKAVIDVDQEIIALDAELHSDLEALLLERGSQQENLWGINLYPEMMGDDFVEFDSMINLRPSLGSLSRGINNEEIRNKIMKIISKIIKR